MVAMRNTGAEMQMIAKAIVSMVVLLMTLQPGWSAHFAARDNASQAAAAAGVPLIVLRETARADQPPVDATHAPAVTERPCRLVHPVVEPKPRCNKHSATGVSVTGVRRSKNEPWLATVDEQPLGAHWSTFVGVACFRLCRTIRPMRAPPCRTLGFGARASHWAMHARTSCLRN